MNAKNNQNKQNYTRKQRMKEKKKITDEKTGERRNQLIYLTYSTCCVSHMHSQLEDRKRYKECEKKPLFNIYTPWTTTRNI